MSNFVLVHGAWHTGELLEDTAAPIRSAGHQVFLPTVSGNRSGDSKSVELEEANVGGGSDGNFTAALGVPTLDGIGGVGEGAHAVNESILIDRIADRTALLARLIAEID